MVLGWPIPSSPSAPRFRSGIALSVRKSSCNGSLKSRSAKKPLLSKASRFKLHNPMPIASMLICLVRSVGIAWLKRSQQQQLLWKKSRSLVKAQKKASWHCAVGSLTDTPDLTDLLHSDWDERRCTTGLRESSH